jgi:hypothetical protein
MAKIFIGCDTGLKGAIGFIFPDGTYDVYDIPTLQIKKGKKIKNVIDAESLKIDFDNILDNSNFNDNNEIEVWLEATHAMPKQGTVAMWSMGYVFGIIEMLFVCNGLYINKVSPQRWKKEVIFGAGSNKLISVQKAEELFPKCEFRTKRGRILDGRAESLLIAEYGKRQSL